MIQLIRLNIGKSYLWWEVQSNLVNDILTNLIVLCISILHQTISFHIIVLALPLPLLDFLPLPRPLPLPLLLCILCLILL